MAEQYMHVVIGYVRCKLSTWDRWLYLWLLPRSCSCRCYYKMSCKRRNEDEQKKYAKKAANFWSMGLLSSMKDPELLMKEDDKIVAIKDKYPKAHYHFLVLPKENICSLAKVTKDHLQLLKHMDKVGQELAESHPTSNFKLGYHAEASMSRLHLHVVSDDFNSTCLKTKKHWNTFTTDFFVPSSKIISEVEKHGEVIFITKDEIKKFMDTPLKCHKCNFLAKNMPSLKSHILIHLKKLL
ncbi:aprataxin isoform X2 [Zootermopsis nevadensis]|uniref:aprataxin isoform X2 n=1 Tax=Zootermopsis nevadensis TaxID=136037 RepID=UPI000B8EA541|nr:aprataxin isoform X2 [Zootermopsis nevadensis]